MRFTTNLIVVLYLTSISPVHGQIFKNITIPPKIEQVIKDLTFEIGINKSKVFNTKKISSFEGDRNNRTYIVNIEKEFYPLTTNYNMSLGYHISKNHHIRVRYAKNTLGSTLIGDMHINSPIYPSSPLISLNRNFSILYSKSIGIIYEYQIAYHEGNFVLGAGTERQKNQVAIETLQIPGIQSRSFSFHSHIGYLAEINQSILLHGKFFSTYYFSGNRQIYESPIDSKYVPLQIGFEIALRLKFENTFHPAKKGEKRKRRKKRR